MSLRVLLADESPSIKKAFDLALKDFAVTVQTVHQGTDVLELFNSFQPDICFLDVLLPKKNGYDACTDIKQNVEAGSPVVLMWSNFMEVDEDKFNSCGAVDRIEKPFETKTLREIVLKHVPRTKQNKISEFLEPIERATNQDQNQSNGNPQEASEVEMPALEMPPAQEQASAPSENALPDLPDIGDLMSDQPAAETAPPALDDFAPFDDSSDISAEPASSDDSDDLFGGLELQENESGDDDDLENFQMEPLESFDAFDGEENEGSIDPSPVADEISDDDIGGDEFGLASNDTPPPVQGLDLGDFGSPSESNSDQIEEADTDPALDTPPLHAVDDDSEDDTDPSISIVNPEMPPLPVQDSVGQIDAELKSFNDDEDETTEPSISVAEEPIISPPTPPALETQDAVPSTAPIPVEDRPPAEEKKFDLNSELTKEELKRLIMAQSKDIIESVVWEVVPELAKEMIKKEIERLTGELNPNEEIR